MMSLFPWLQLMTQSKEDAPKKTGKKPGHEGNIQRGGAGAEKVNQLDNFKLRFRKEKTKTSGGQCKVGYVNRALGDTKEI